ncbi:lytic transglycosylase domain-containing protein [Kushneria aurantia]|uniref:Lytic transglycosylase domain-containing protein n=1 Tax=Kushneria aurantia TaxID=504092 RepID=A0ABV6G704_9GAMM|nr:lytic transglycosylase domain-containing protein [Kushneria aurantia]
MTSFAGNWPERTAVALFCATLLFSAGVNGAAQSQPVAPALIQRLAGALATTTAHEGDRFDTTVWLTDMSARLRPWLESRDERLALLEKIHREAARAGLDRQLVLAVIDVESRFDREALSSAGARGLMQVMPFWKTEIGRREDNLFDPATNLRYGCTILAFYLEREDGDITRALARYNGSLGESWYPERVMARLDHHWWVE